MEMVFNFGDVLGGDLCVGVVLIFTIRRRWTWEEDVSVEAATLQREEPLKAVASDVSHCRLDVLSEVKAFWVSSSPVSSVCV